MSDGTDPKDQLREAADEAVSAVGEWRGAPPVVRTSAERLDGTRKLRDAAEMTVNSLSSWKGAPPEVRQKINDLDRAIDKVEDDGGS